MRVISGSARGCNLLSPEGLDTRPTTDRIKETLFNIIAFDLAGSRFLDLFSGSGAIAIEALSRGADKAVLVDSSETCRKIIEANLKHTRLDKGARVIIKDVFDAIKLLKSEGQKFDIVFIDPPYMEGFNESVLKAIVEADLLDGDGKIILERSSKTEQPSVEGLTIYREKEYRTTVMTFLTLEE